MRILFVCTGNTCRSPMAEAILRKIADENNIVLEIQSAGVSAFEGDYISKNANQVLKEKRIPHSHRSKLVTDSLVEWADLVLVMTSQHKEVLVYQYPDVLDKTYTLIEYADLDDGSFDPDIQDPYGGALKEYRRCAEQIEENLRKIIDKKLK